MRTMQKVIASLIMAYVLIGTTIYLFQRSLIYPVPQAYRTTPAAAGFPEAEEASLTTSDGEEVIVWHVAPQPGHPVILFFHGNGEVLAMRAQHFRILTADGTGLVALSFRGYGGSTGHPTERGLFNDADAAYDFASARYKSDRLIIWGYSLGTGVALNVATTHPVGKVILEAPYTSMADMAAEAFPLLPARWLTRDRFQSDQRIARLKAPILIMHGEEDTVIPFRMGQRLFSLAPEPKQFVGFPSGTHFNLESIGAIEVARKFMAGTKQN